MDEAEDTGGMAGMAGAKRAQAPQRFGAFAPEGTPGATRVQRGTLGAAAVAGAAPKLSWGLRASRESRDSAGAVPLSAVSALSALSALDQSKNKPPITFMGLDAVETVGTLEDILNPESVHAETFRFVTGGGPHKMARIRRPKERLFVGTYQPVRDGCEYS